MPDTDFLKYFRLQLSVAKYRVPIASKTQLHAGHDDHHSCTLWRGTTLTSSLDPCDKEIADDCGPAWPAGHMIVIYRM